MFKKANDYLDDYLAGEGKFELEMITKYNSPRGILLCCYSTMVGRKQLVKIEDLADDQKQILWDACKQYTTGLNAEECKDVVRSIYLFNALAAKRDAV